MYYCKEILKLQQEQSDIVVNDRLLNFLGIIPKVWGESFLSI